MALLTKKKEGTPAQKAVASQSKGTKKDAKPVAGAGAKLTKVPVRIIKTPRVTEKAARMTMQSGYVFEVSMDATKRDVVKVVEALYGVTPRKVNIVCKQPRAYVARMRNRRGTKAGMKKAYVFLKKGEKIDLAK